MYFFKPLSLLFLFLLPSMVFADQIYLQNGDHISGEFLNLSPTFCTFKPPYQTKPLQIKREHILRLSTNKRVSLELYSGERLLGTFTSQQNGMLSLHSQQLGILTIPFSQIKQIGKFPLSPLLHKTKFREEQIEKTTLNSFLQKEEFQPLVAQTIHGKGTQNIENSNSSTKSPSESMTIGQQDEENLKQLFLRNAAVLLKPGEKETEFFFGYALDQDTNLRNRDLTLLGSLRFGITPKLESFINVPIIWAEQENSSESHYSKNDHFGLGDISLGFNYLFAVEKKQQPDIIGSLTVTIPTAEEPDMLASETIAVGSGQWHLTTVLNLVKNYEPATLFGSLSYSHTFPHTFNDGVQVAPGDSFGYQFGFGFAINHQLALFSTFFGNYQMETRLNDIKIRGSVREPMSLEVGLSYAISKHNYLQPTLTLGLNDDTTDTIFGLSYIRRIE